jgi:DNA-binding transcriptional MerR regulator
MADSSPTFTAELLDIKPLTLRRWCEYHAEHLSAGTNPPSGQSRRFTDKDIEVLKHIKHLRSQGFNTAIINERLAGLTFAEIDTDEPTDDSEELVPVAAQEGLQATQAIGIVVESLQKRFDALEAAHHQARQEDRQSRDDMVKGFAIGFLVAGFLFLGMVLLSWLYGGG